VKVALDVEHRAGLVDEPASVDRERTVAPAKIPKGAIRVRASEGVDRAVARMIAARSDSTRSPNG